LIHTLFFANPNDRKEVTLQFPNPRRRPCATLAVLRPKVHPIYPKILPRLAFGSSAGEPFVVLREPLRRHLEVARSIKVALKRFFLYFIVESTVSLDQAILRPFWPVSLLKSPQTGLDKDQPSLEQ